MAEYFPFYESFKQAADMLPDAERLQLYDMITDYGCLGIEPESGNSIVLAMFVLIRPSIDSAKRSQNSGAKGGRGNRKAETNESETNISGSENPPLHNCKPPLGETGKHTGNSKGDSNSNRESNGEGEGESKTHAAQRFTPPTLQEVEAYALESGLKLDAASFIDYYTANGWMVGKVRMKDWKASVRNWERQDKKYSASTAKSSGTHKFSPEGRDLSFLEK